MTMSEKLNQLKEYLLSQGSMAVAFSGGVDSTFLLKVAHDMLGNKCVAVTASSCSFPERELNELFGFTFEGLDVSKRLFLPEDMLETQGKGQIMVTPLKELVEKNIGSPKAPEGEVEA